MINEILNEKEIKEENKILEAIHRQAKDRYCFEKGKRYLKAQKKESKYRIIEDLLNFGLLVIAVIPTILLLVVLCF